MENKKKKKIIPWDNFSSCILIFFHRVEFEYMQGAFDLTFFFLFLIIIIFFIFLQVLVAAKI